MGMSFTLLLFWSFIYTCFFCDTDSLYFCTFLRRAIPHCSLFLYAESYIISRTLVLVLSLFYHTENVIRCLVIFGMISITDLTKYSLNVSHFEFQFSFCRIYLLLNFPHISSSHLSHSARCPIAIWMLPWSSPFSVVSLYAYLSLEGGRYRCRHLGMFCTLKLHSWISGLYSDIVDLPVRFYVLIFIDICALCVLQSRCCLLPDHSPRTIGVIFLSVLYVFLIWIFQIFHHFSPRLL